MSGRIPAMAVPCARDGCGHPYYQHEYDDRFVSVAGACDFGMSAANPEGDCAGECMAFIEPGQPDQLPLILARQNN